MSTPVSPLELTHDESRRYGRHLIMPEVGVKGQLKLKQASVLCIGAGGLGSPLMMYLAAAGIGRIGIVDYDVVDHSNLQRQIIHGSADVGKPKLESAARRIKDINPNVEVISFNEPFTAESARRIVKDFDYVVDGTDNYPTRYLVNDVCVLEGKVNIYGSIFRFEGQATVFDAKNGPCYRCIYPEPPPPGLVPNCAEGGVLGVLPGIVGVMQATEVIKQILGAGDSLVGRLVQFDALEMKFREFKIRKNPDCVLCSDHPTVTELIDYEAFCGAPAHDGVQTAVSSGEDLIITAEQLKARMDAGDGFLLVDVRNPEEWEINRLPGARLVPLPEIERRLDEFNVSGEIVLYCHKGVRSMRALEKLQSVGYKNLKSLVGGVDLWAQKIDTEMLRY